MELTAPNDPDWTSFGGLPDTRYGDPRHTHFPRRKVVQQPHRTVVRRMAVLCYNRLKRYVTPASVQLSLRWR
jgi:hypothetical protein